MFHEDRPDEILNELGWETNPVLRRYLGRPKSSAVLAASHAFRLAAACMASGAGLFALAALDVVPGFGPWENIGLVLVSMFLFSIGIFSASWWSNLDRALHREPSVDSEWTARSRVALVLRYVAAVVGGGLALVAGTRIREQYPDNPIPAWLALVGGLIALLLSLVFVDYRRRRSRRR